MKAGNKSRSRRTGGDTPLDKQIYRYEVELMELASGTSRRVPLKIFRMVPLEQKKGETVPLPWEEMRLQDGDVNVVASTFEEFRQKLREQYPDERFERRLHYWRDREEEERQLQAITRLGTVILMNAVKRMME